MKKTYEYEVGSFRTETREAARIIQRALRTPEAKAQGITSVPKIIQKLTTVKVIR